MHGIKKENSAQNLAAALGDGEKTAKVVAEAERLMESVRRLGASAPKPKRRLAPPLGTTLTRASRRYWRG